MKKNVYYEVSSQKGIHLETLSKSEAEVFVKNMYQNTGVLAKIDEVTRDDVKE